MKYANGRHSVGSIYRLAHLYLLHRDTVAISSHPRVDQQRSSTFMAPVRAAWERASCSSRSDPLQSSSTVRNLSKPSRSAPRCAMSKPGVIVGFEPSYGTSRVALRPSFIVKAFGPGLTGSLNVAPRTSQKACTHSNQTAGSLVDSSPHRSDPMSLRSCTMSSIIDRYFSRKRAAVSFAANSRSRNDIQPSIGNLTAANVDPNLSSIIHRAPRQELARGGVRRDEVLFISVLRAAADRRFVITTPLDRSLRLLQGGASLSHHHPEKAQARGDARGQRATGHRPTRRHGLDTAPRPAPGWSPWPILHLIVGGAKGSRPHR